MRPSTSSTRRHSRATAPRTKSELTGPMRAVVYIFEREGERGGAFWWLVLDCGHAVARKRYTSKRGPAQIHLLFIPLERKFAPKRAECHYCEAGSPKQDPWIMVRALGGPT
jgi:hypothetical protein